MDCSKTGFSKSDCGETDYSNSDCGETDYSKVDCSEFDYSDSDCGETDCNYVWHVTEYCKMEFCEQRIFAIEPQVVDLQMMWTKFILGLIVSDRGWSTFAKNLRT